MSNPKDRELAVFSAARRLPAGERAAHLDAACAGDAALRKRVEELLQASEEAGGFLQDPAPGAQRPAATLVLPNPLPNGAAPGEKAGDHIGRYKLLQQIGEGGCGVVYMAEQEEPVRRRVALKVIKLGMDTKQVVARFEAERQALALMDHPNIAKVLEAGATDTGRPYFVMELVRGIKITDYCDENNLSTRERLDLFTRVAQAIQHAHQKGIIHRDLKPSNVLVADHDGVPVPKVIDFGIAKATTDQRLTDKTLFTAFEQFIGTPAYMSPEQARMSGLDIDTRTDIYSLGVLLYELLTGKTPFDAEDLLAAGLDEMRRTISEKEPARPSTRLSTMLEFELTTTAKHRRTDAPKLIHLLRGDLDWIVMKALEKDRARRYETANGLATDIQRYLKNEPVVARPPSAGYRFQKLVRRNKLAFVAVAAISTILVLGVVMSTWQAVRATRSEREQSRLREAAQQVQASEAKLRQEAEADKKKAETEAAKSQQVAQFLRDMLNGVGPSVALGRDTTMLREILDKTAQRVGQDLTNHPQVEAELRDTIGEVYQALGQYQKAETMYRQALAIERKWQGNENTNVAHSLNHLASVLRANSRPGGAEPFAREAVAIQRKLFGNDHPEVADAMDNLAKVLQNRGQLADAEKMFRETLGMRRKLLGPDHPDVAGSLVGLAGVLQRRAEWAEAEMTSREALNLQKKLFGEENPDVAASLYRLAVVLLGQGKLDQAEIRHREALALRRKLYGSEHRIIVESLTGLADLLCRQGKLEEVHQLFRQELANAPKPYPYTPRTRPDPLYSILGVLLTKQEFSRAELLVDGLLTPAIEHQPQSVGLLVTRANYFARRSQWKQAATDFGKVVQLDPTNTLAWYFLAPALIESGDLELYERYRLEMSKRFAGTSYGRITKACLLLPAESEVLAVAVKIAETESIVGLGDPFYPYMEFTRGLAELRQRQYVTAKQWLDKTLAHGWSDGNLVAPAQALLSIVHHHLGRPEDARADLAKAVNKAQGGWPRSTSGDLGGSWNDWIMVQIFVREAKALIEDDTRAP